ncbi:hypothetical protein M3Y96_00740500 [Aphelenchoides besseyi]|nr:hypothetical protein M3Y96_00740500 [Aphelenchoides besseyi]
MNALGEAALFPKLEFPVETEPEPQTCCGMAASWPKGSLLIFAADFFERFVFYGIKVTLALYFMKTIGADPVTSTLVLQTFLFGSYVFPFLGAILADSFLGKFPTIICMSIAYIVGLCVLTYSSMKPMGSPYHPNLDFFGLFLIAVGSGGVKPCLTTFGADQFKPSHVSMISTYFALFYLLVSLGGVFSTLFVPVFGIIPCLNQNSCYPFAFGLFALLILISVAAFGAGMCLYTPSNPTENVVLRVLDVIKIGPNRDYWIDHYLDVHDCSKSLECIQASRGRPTGASPNCPHAKFLDEIKAMIRLIIILIPIVFFWALYEQQSNLWLIQASSMEPHISQMTVILPNRMFLVEIGMLVLLIPFFQCMVFPYLGMCGVRITYLRRMIIGGFFAVMAFGFSAVIQMGLSQTMPTPPNSGNAVLSVVNIFPSGCNAMIADIPGYATPAVIPGGKSLIDNPLLMQRQVYHIPIEEETRITVGIKLNGQVILNIVFTVFIFSSCSGHSLIRHSITAVPGSAYYLVIGPQGVFSNEAIFQKPTEGKGLNTISVNLAIPCKFLPQNIKSWGACAGLNSEIEALNAYSGALAVCRQDPNVTACNPMDPSGYYEWPAESWTNQILRAFPPVGDNPQGRAHFTFYPPTARLGSGEFQVFYVQKLANPTTSETTTNYEPVKGAEFKIDGIGGVYTLIVGISGSVLDDSANNVALLHQIQPQNFMSIIVQFPQYFLMTVAEILFSITGLELFYTQAPPSMRTIAQAFWFFAIGLGNLLAFFLSTIHLFSDLVVGLLMIAAGLLFTTIALFILSLLYFRYTNFTSIEDDRERLLRSELGLDNEAFKNSGNTFVTRL